MLNIVVIIILYDRSSYFYVSWCMYYTFVKRTGCILHLSQCVIVYRAVTGLSVIISLLIRTSHLCRGDAFVKSVTVLFVVRRGVDLELW